MQSTVPFVVVPVLKLWLTTTQSIRGWLCRFNTQSCHHAEYCSVRGWFCRFNTRSFSRLFLVAHSASSSVLEEVNMSDEWSSGSFAPPERAHHLHTLWNVRLLGNLSETYMRHE